MPSTLSSLTPVDDANLVSAAHPEVSALFFNDRFTGNGKGRGLLNDSLSPLNFVARYAADNAGKPINERLHHSRLLEGGVDTSDDFYIPLHPMMEAVYQFPMIQHRTGPLLTSGYLMGTFTHDEHQCDYEVRVLITPQAAHLNKIKHQVAENETTLHLRYRLQIMFAPVGVTVPDTAPSAPFTAGGVVVHQFFTYDVLGVTTAFLRSFVPDASSTFDMAAFEVYLGSLNIHDLIVEQANLWVRGEMVADLLAIADQMSNDEGLLTEGGQQILTRQMTYLESYTFDINYYFQLYTGLSNILESKTLQVISMGNLKMLLNVDLASYGEVVKGIDFVPAFDQRALEDTQAVTGITYSAEQAQIVTSPAPAMMTSSGAGTGKSTAMVGRAYYLQFCGILPQDIQFYTFTRAGRDNILSRAPGVQSVTNDSFIQRFYGHNYPQHIPSEVSSVLNMLTYRLADDPEATVLHKLLSEANSAKATVSDRMKLTVHVQYNFESVIRVLDEIRMTTSDLQRIISYINLENMAEPDTVAPFVIIDEVQDNSIFEFMFFLRRAALRRQSLAMVGDASQTMYAFRSADPKALNALEASGIFQVYKMTENYRSNQEILAFANDFLVNIDANRMSQIQLVSPQAIPEDMTVETFTNTVSLHSWMLDKTRGTDENGNKALSAYEQVLATFQGMGMRFISEKMAANESVCVIAPSRRLVTSIEEMLREDFPDKTIENITSDRPYSISHLTEFVAEGFDELHQVPLDKVPFALYQGLERFIRDKVHTQASKSTSPDAINRKIETLMRPVQSWRTSAGAHAQSLVAQGMAGALTQEQVIRGLSDSLAQFESTFNQAQIHQTSIRNQERKAANENRAPDITVSTFHGTKGLEYDHLLLVVNQDDLFKPYGSDQQESLKRLIYVGITRARISEFILAYRSSTNGKDDIMSQRYKLVKTSIAQVVEQRQADQESERDRLLTSLSDMTGVTYDDLVLKYENVSLDELKALINTYSVGTTGDPDEVDSKALRQKLIQHFADTMGIPLTSIDGNIANVDMVSILSNMGQDVSVYSSLVS